MLTKRVEAFVKEIKHDKTRYDTIKHDKDNRYDKTLATNEAHRELHGEVQWNQKRLFNASKSLLKISKFAGLLLSSDDHQLANNFGDFFTNNINAIRLKLQTRSIRLISEMPMVRLLIPLFQNSTFSPNPRFMA